MDNVKFDKLESKLDKLDERLDEVAITLVKNTASLDEHMNRSLANEKAVQILKQELSPVISYIQKIRWGINGILWLAGAIIAVLGAVEGLSKLGLI